MASTREQLLADLEALRQLKMRQEQKAAEFLMKANDTDERMTRLQSKIDKLPSHQHKWTTDGHHLNEFCSICFDESPRWKENKARLSREGR